MTSLVVTVDGQTYHVEFSLAAGSKEAYQVKVNGETAQVVLPPARTAEVEWLIIDQRPYEVHFDANLQWIRAYDGLHAIEVHDYSQRVARPRSGDGRVKAPIPGLIVRTLVAPGEPVQVGQPLVVLEAMKMENEIRAPFEGTVSTLPVSPGQTVIRNEVLVEIV